MNTEKNILVAFKKRWHFMEGLELGCYALGPAVFCYFLSESFFITLGVFVSVLLIGLAYKKPWQLTLKKISQYVDKTLEIAEYSSGLLLPPPRQLSSVALLQRRNVSELLKHHIHQIEPNVSLKRALLVLAGFVLLTVVVKQSDWPWHPNGLENKSNAEKALLFQPLDSSMVKTEPPAIVEQKLFIRYPAYTKLPTMETSNMNVKALEGSQLSWRLQFDKPVSKVTLEHMDNSYPMTQHESDYMGSSTLRTSGFYSFKFIATDSASYQSELFALEMFQDEPPQIKLPLLKQYTSFDFQEEKSITFETILTDDYGISEAFIVATVSKGEGESVKFREERLRFDKPTKIGEANQKLSKRIDLHELKMEPGDELYFYITAIDNKLPRPNIAKSETYFAVIQDTVSSQFAVEGSMGADLMPDYFRSQRQLIIDTEKLIAGKSKLAKKEFNITSNALGFDQKALRLKYGQFMGDEAESGIQGGVEEELEAMEEEEDTDNPLAAYTHDHDGDHDHDHSHHEHEEEESDENGENLLERYLHNHDDPEESTLFTQSLKSKLRQAMAEMWDAELYLRLYKPEKSLPYQYRALKLIQEIKNSARIYVHRIGFDPPPIKEEKRLTGDMKEVKSFQKQVDLGTSEKFTHMRAAVERLELLLQGGPPKPEDKRLFSKAGDELAELAINEPGRHLETLQNLKWISASKNAFKVNQLQTIQRGLLSALPKPNSKPVQQSASQSELNDLFLKQLELND